LAGSSQSLAGPERNDDKHRRELEWLGPVALAQQDWLNDDNDDVCNGRRKWWVGPVTLARPEQFGVIVKR
jgi:hypothetical protein